MAAALRYFTCKVYVHRSVHNKLCEMAYAWIKLTIWFLEAFVQLSRSWPNQMYMVFFFIYPDIKNKIK